MSVRVIVRKRAAVIALLAATAGVSWASAEAPATAPTSAPATQAVATTQPATRLASTGPTTRRPTPAELIAQMRAKQKEVDALPKVAMITLDSAVTEKPGQFNLFGGGAGGETLWSLMERIEGARDDKDVRALVIVMTANASMNLAQAGEIRDLLGTFRKAGKRVFVYADSYDTVGYTMASGASDVVLLEGGELFMPGIGIETQFYKGLMDKVGVKGDYVQVGEYKGAEEPFTRATPSEPLREEMNKLVGGLYAQVVAGVSRARGLPEAVVQQAVDDAMIPAKAARDRKLVDHLADRESLRDLVEAELNTEKLNVINDYGADAKPELDFSNPFAFLAQMGKKAAPTDRDTVAIVYAEGTIVDGTGGGGGLPIPVIGDSGPSVGSEDIRKAMRAIRDDPNVKAVVIRIDSPGGSALASEVMWQAVRKTAGDRPVIISIGSMAASGGYYLASAGDHVVAEPTGIVGSIGVVGGKFVLKGLYDKLGITGETFAKGRNADLFSSSTEWTERQRRMVANMMRATYDQFTDRIMTTRRGKIADIDKVARGRIFVSADALALGMVDELGGLGRAVDVAAERASLTDGDYDVRVFPESRGVLDLFGSAGGGGSPLARGLAGGNVTVTTGSIAETSVLRLMSPGQRKTLLQHLQILGMLQERPVVLAAPFTITVR